MSEVMIHIRSLVCGGINKKANVQEDSKINLCTLARSLLTPTEAITFLADYNIPDVLIPESLNDAFTQEARMLPEAISGSSPKLTPGSPPEIQPIWRTMNKTLPLEAKLDLEAISVPAPNIASWDPAKLETLPRWPDIKSSSLGGQNRPGRL